MPWSSGYPTVCHTVPALCFSGSTCTPQRRNSCLPGILIFTVKACRSHPQSNSMYQQWILGCWV